MLRAGGGKRIARAVRWRNGLDRLHQMMGDAMRNLLLPEAEMITEGMGRAEERLREMEREVRRLLGISSHPCIWCGSACEEDETCSACEGTFKKESERLKREDGDRTE